ncbi:PilN domain-containing protein [Anaeromyxobacter sp. Fw109-5]|uniref:PilN domain-containing protein n=1 Tax=Anaeromyxobacter sp. (strain Fw109-5) TaxID=404589 RepID=UPI0000ED7856|nr:PilN domain-containing protein [Anaeromyxobacter sp. Fw109-5]ABS24900.1 Fimbrial assembly family protein [Anaeromyxobacter sp. Fw109-5]
MVRINLLPVRVSKKKEAGKQQLILFALVLVLGVVVNYLWAASRADALATKQAAVKRTKDEIAQLDRIIGEVKNIKEQQAQLREKLEVLAQLKTARTGPVKMLDELATLTPKRLWLRKLEEKGGAVTIDGTASTIDDVSELMTALGGSTQFRNVELKKTASKTDGGFRTVDFTLTATVAYAAKPASGPAAGKKG